MGKVNDSLPWATILLGVLVLVVAAVGGAVVIWGKPGALSFDQYLKALEGFAIAIGILGVGRGVASFGKQNANATILSDSSLAPGPQPVAAPWSVPIEPDYPPAMPPAGNGLPIVADGEVDQPALAAAGTTPIDG